jgi:hypothetical protein
MYSCENSNCTLNITEGSRITNCTAKNGVGGAIYSDINIVDFDYKNAFLENNSAPTGPNIYTFAMRLVIIPNVTSEVELRNYTRDHFEKDLKEGRLDKPPVFILKSGFHVAFGIVLLDHQNNIVASNNDDIATVTNDSQNVRLEKSVAKISKGMAILEKVSIVAESLKSYKMVFLNLYFLLK